MKGRICTDTGSGVAAQVDGGIGTRIEIAYGVCNERLKLQYDESRSNFAFKISHAPLHHVQSLGDSFTSFTGRG
jgi:hypothetical protein